mmetsp:Transcript_1020/g.3720  ORF Transcript_1020/g.3720 Transcript_1020/m.3720 type:complete len:272 (+) Transcript_1020:253-1068(+)
MRQTQLSDDRPRRSGVGARRGGGVLCRKRMEVKPFAAAGLCVGGVCGVEVGKSAVELGFSKVEIDHVMQLTDPSTQRRPRVRLHGAEFWRGEVGAQVIAALVARVKLSQRGHLPPRSFGVFGVWVVWVGGGKGVEVSPCVGTELLLPRPGIILLRAGLLHATLRAFLLRDPVHAGLHHGSAGGVDGHCVFAVDVVHVESLAVRLGFHAVLAPEVIVVVLVFVVDIRSEFLFSFWREERAPDFRLDPGDDALDIFARHFCNLVTFVEQRQPR